MSLLESKYLSNFSYMFNIADLKFIWGINFKKTAEK